ncbi:nucleotidyltransferase-like protein [Paraburkholderia sp. BL8N3]|nr:GSU2403 family nucleotidyltransferase fold protein [Paraburkholderia sp. BL8N3]TCK31802.1 nucleotidyltransferase-like protein [Paraburkholderia sp. BL8N3]
MNDLRPFVTLATALADWRAEIVFVGCWAHRLFRLDGRALANPAFDPIFTRDADVAFGDRATLEGDIRRALLNAGFKEAFFGEERPPVTQYTLGTELGGFYAEFLTEQRGSGIKRDGGADATLVKAGIVAQKLRHLDLLMVAPWEVNIPEGVGDAAEKIDGLRVPNPVTFIAQKVLIQVRQ